MPVVRPLKAVRPRHVLPTGSATDSDREASIQEFWGSHQGTTGIDTFITPVMALLGPPQTAEKIQKNVNPFTDALVDAEAANIHHSITGTSPFFESTLHRWWSITRGYHSCIQSRIPSRRGGARAMEERDVKFRSVIFASTTSE